MTIPRCYVCLFDWLAGKKKTLGLTEGDNLSSYLSESVYIFIGAWVSESVYLSISDCVIDREKYREIG